MSQTTPEPTLVTPTTGEGGAPPSGSEPEVLYCVNHPGVETLLRCNRCGKPICLKCAQLTDVGYRCKECIRGVQSKYFTAVPTDNLVAFGVGLVVTAIAAPIVGLLLRLIPLFFGVILSFMIGGAAGGVLAQIIRTAIGRRRGRNLPYFALGGIILGVLIGSVIGLFFGIPTLHLSMLVFTVLAAAAAYQILR